MTKITAVIYDLDDTMVNSDPLHARAWERLLGEYGHEFRALPETLRSHFIGMRVIDIVSEIADYLKLPASKDELYQKRVDYYLELMEKELQAMPGLLESLQRFQKAGLRLAVASSGAARVVDIVLERFKIRDFFDAVITGDDVKTGKPHPDAYLFAAGKLGANPAACLVLEDAAKGIQSAKAAGCLCIAVRNPNVPPQDFSQADAVVDSLNEVTLAKIDDLNR